MEKPKFWKEACKFLSGAFFVTAGASWYFSFYGMAVPLMGYSMTPRFLFVRGFIHFGLFLATFYIGFMKKKRVL